MATISNMEAALLGLLCEKPKHAYEIESDIKFRDMRYWTEISMSSVYKVLRKLEERGLLESEVKLSEKNVAQKVYTVTEMARKQYTEKLIELLSGWESVKHPIDIALANMHLLDRKQALDCLRRYGESVDKMIKCYGELEDFLVGEKCALGNIQLATRRIHLLMAEKKWLEEFMEGYANE